MGNLSDVDTTNVGEMSEGFKAVPPGTYMMMIESSERKTYGQKEKLEVVFLVVGGDHDKAKFREWFEFWDADPEKVARWNARWKALCEAALGQPSVPNGDSSGLHSKLFYGEVSNEPQWNKDLNAPDPSKRTNKMVWKKGAIRGLKEQGAAPSGFTAGQAAAAPVQQQTAAAAQPAQTQAVAAPVVPGKGPPPWAAKK